MSEEEKTLSKSTSSKKKKAGLEVEMEWRSPERIWSPKTRVWYLSYAALFTLLILASARLGYFIMILALLALMFLLFVQATVEPLIAKHQITNHGIITRDVLLKWEQLNSFWFGQKKDQLLLYLDFKPEEKHPRITLLVNPGDDQKIFDHVIPFTKYAGTQDAEVNIISQLIYGKYIPVGKYLIDLDQPK